MIATITAVAAILTLGYIAGIASEYLFTRREVDDLRFEATFQANMVRERGLRIVELEALAIDASFVETPAYRAHVRSAVALGNEARLLDSVRSWVPVSPPEPVA